eukprot:6468153-Amphidinium_carterae.1
MKRKVMHSDNFSWPRHPEERDRPTSGSAPTKWFVSTYNMRMPLITVSPLSGRIPAKPFRAKLQPSSAVMPRTPLSGSDPLKLLS